MAMHQTKMILQENYSSELYVKIINKTLPRITLVKMVSLGNWCCCLLLKKVIGIQERNKILNPVL